MRPTLAYGTRESSTRRAPVRPCPLFSSARCEPGDTQSRSPISFLVHAVRIVELGVGGARRSWETEHGTDAAGCTKGSAVSGVTAGASGLNKGKDAVSGEVYILYEAYPLATGVGASSCTRRVSLDNSWIPQQPK